MSHYTHATRASKAKMLTTGFAAGVIAFSLGMTPFAMAAPPAPPSGGAGGGAQASTNTVSSSKAKATVTANGKTVKKKSKTIKATSKDRNVALAKKRGYPQTHRVHP